MNNKKSTGVSKPKVFQVLVRLPEDIAARFVQVVKPGQRNSYFLDLLRRDLDRESNELAQAAQALTALESKSGSLQKEDAAWLNAALMLPDDDFDAAAFDRQYQAVKKARKASNEATNETTNETTAARVARRVPTKPARAAVPRTRKPLKAA